METLVHAAAFRFEETECTWGDVVLAAIAWGEWQRLECTLAEGLACAAASDPTGESVDPAVIHRAVVAFRRARGLLAAEDYVHWLADRSLEPSDLECHLERMALRDRAGAQLDAILGSHPPHPELIARTIHPEAILSGRLQSWAERLARCAAAQRGLLAAGDQPPTPSDDAVTRLLADVAAHPASGLAGLATDGHERLVGLREQAGRVSALVAAEQAFCDRTVTRERIERCLTEHRLDWQRFVWDEATFAREGAAREAALSVREDETTLGAVAALAQARVETREAYFDQARDLAGLLAASTPGEVIGPLACDRGWRVLRVRERAAAGIDDAPIRARARRELLEDALQRHLAGRVHWHGEH
jgi:hypothetical protein